MYSSMYRLETVWQAILAQHSKAGPRKPRPLDRMIRNCPNAAAMNVPADGPGILQRTIGSRGSELESFNSKNEVPVFSIAQSAWRTACFGGGAESDRLVLAGTEEYHLVTVEEGRDVSPFGSYTSGLAWTESTGDASALVEIAGEVDAY